MKSTPSPKDIKNLSSYLDDQLNEDQKKKIELRLKNDAALKLAFQNLRLTRLVLRNAPQAKVPRNFVLNLEMVKAQKSSWTYYSSMRLVSSIASILFVFVFLGDFINSNSLSFNSKSQNSSMEAEIAVGAFSDEGTSMDNNDVQEMLAAPLISEELEPVEMPATLGVVEPSAEIPDEAGLSENEIADESAVDEVFLATPASPNQGKQGDIESETEIIELGSVGDSEDILTETEVLDINGQGNSEDGNLISEDLSTSSYDLVNLFKYILGSIALTTGLLNQFYRRR
jgi:hypothetical protein